MAMHRYSARILDAAEERQLHGAYQPTGLEGVSTILYPVFFIDQLTSWLMIDDLLDARRNVRGRPLIVDPGLYMSTKQDIFTVTQRRELPTAFKLYTGSAWMALTRDFVEYLLLGWESNLPRTLLMYYTNFVSSPEFYFQTLLCNTPRFVPTVANHDLHHIQWGKPAGQHPLNLRLADKGRMVSSNAPFARKIGRDDPLLDAIDAELLLGRGKNATAGMFVPGGWCGQSGNCSAAAAGVDDWMLRPGPGAERLGRLMDRIVRSEAFVNDQCK
jgi:protein xylosyltransferase